MIELLVKEPIWDEHEPDTLLKPLQYGKPVVLRVTDPKMRIKKRASMPLLFITTLDTYYERADKQTLILSMPGYGCEMSSIDDLKATQLYHMGLTMRASKVLVHELQKLFSKHKRGTHDNT